VSRQNVKNSRKDPSVTGSPALDGLLIILFLASVPAYFIYTARKKASEAQRRRRALEAHTKPFRSSFGTWALRFYKSRNRLKKGELESLKWPSKIGRMVLFQPGGSRSSLDRVSLAISSKYLASSPGEIETLVVFDRRWQTIGQYVGKESGQKYGTVRQEECLLYFVETKNWNITGFRKFIAAPLAKSSSGSSQRALVDDVQVAAWLESLF
jgi:hypothetical protein